MVGALGRGRENSAIADCNLYLNYLWVQIAAS